jgi:Cu+-exporting ATPase
VGCHPRPTSRARLSTAHQAFGKIIHAVERAEKPRAPIQGIADRLAGYLVYFALAAAALTFLITHNTRSTISVVIVAGACGIAAGTPLAILGGIGRSAQIGSIIKGGLYLESLAAIDTILIDKTGTLTYGIPEVVGVHPVEGVPVASLLQAAATAESRSEHPVANSILTKASEMGISANEPERFDYIPGKGIAVASDDNEIIVGNRLFLAGHRIVLPPKDPSQTDSEIFVAQRTIARNSRGRRYTSPRSHEGDTRSQIHAIQDDSPHGRFQGCC